jgi:hypothetical protein
MAVVDLPQPLSPTMEKVSPRLMLNDTPSTARTTAVVLVPSRPPLTGEVDLQVLDLQQGRGGLNHRRGRPSGGPRRR